MQNRIQEKVKPKHFNSYNQQHKQIQETTATPFLDNFDQEFGFSNPNFDQPIPTNPFDQFNQQKQDQGVLEQVMDPDFLSLNPKTMKTPFD